MKKLILFFIFVLGLTGCGAGDTQSLQLNKKQLQNYNDKIKTELQSYYWNYDESSNEFESGYVETTQSPNFDAVVKACESVGLDIKKYSGNEVVVAATDLKHFNDEQAGRAYFYFNGRNLIGEYYKFNNKIYSINDKNIFLKDVNFNNYENTQLLGEFEQNEIKIKFDDYKDMDSSGNFAVIDDDYKMSVYKLSKNNSFRTIKNISYAGEGLYPMEFCFGENYCAVLLGKNDEASNTSQSIEYEDEHSSGDEKQYNLKSWKVEFLDKNFNKKSESIELDLSTYTCVNVFNGKLFLSRGNSIDVFEKSSDGTWIKSSQFMLKNNINSFKFADIDGDGNEEIVAIDGMDLYVFEYNEVFDLIWRTNLSINSMKESLYTGDLNGDGIQEIYIEDLSDTTARYILDKKGFKSYSEGIGYLHKFIVGDFNADGKTDYIEKIISEDDNNEKFILNIAK